MVLVYGIEVVGSTSSVGIYGILVYLYIWYTKSYIYTHTAVGIYIGYMVYHILYMYHIYTSTYYTA